jgi:hypothetical protein
MLPRRPSRFRARIIVSLCDNGMNAVSDRLPPTLVQDVPDPARGWARAPFPAGRRVSANRGRQHHDHRDGGDCVGGDVRLLWYSSSSATIAPAVVFSVPVYIEPCLPPPLDTDQYAATRLEGVCKMAFSPARSNACRGCRRITTRELHRSPLRAGTGLNGSARRLSGVLTRWRLGPGRRGTLRVVDETQMTSGAVPDRRRVVKPGLREIREGIDVRAARSVADSI